VHENTKKFVDRYRNTPWNVGCLAVVNFIKTVAELITLVALFQFVGAKFDAPAVAVAALIVNVFMGIYIGTQITRIFDGEIRARFPNFRQVLWVSLPLNMLISVAVAWGSQRVIAGLILKELSSK